MKEIILPILLGTVLVLGGCTAKVNAESHSSSEQKTIVISDSPTSDQDTYAVYKLSGGKMVKTSKSLKVVNSKGLRNWKATEERIDGKNWWKIGKNKYFKSDRVEVVNVKKTKEIKIDNKISNYAN